MDTRIATASRVGAIEVRPQMTMRAGDNDTTWDEAVNRQ